MKQASIEFNGHTFVIRYEGDSDSLAAAFEACYDFANNRNLSFTGYDYTIARHHSEIILNQNVQQL